MIALTTINFLLLVVTEKNLTNSFGMLLKFLLDIFNSKITLKKAEFKQRNIEKK